VHGQREGRIDVYTRRVLAISAAGFVSAGPNVAAVTDERIEIFVHRYHRRISEIETWLVDALGPICQDHAESMHEENGWRPEVVVWICRFSGIRGAMAFFDAKEEVFDAGSSHPDFDRLEELAEEAGHQAARLANGRQ
jgi:hypothetical protein